MSFSSIKANWPAPSNIHALTTTRCGGMSRLPFASMNMGDHVGDSDANVSANRQRLQQQLSLPAAPFWMQQVHSTDAIEAQAVVPTTTPVADACFTANVNIVCAVMTADCVPIVLCAPQTGEIAAIHAGWRGLCDGVIEKTVAQLNLPGQQLIAWIGPCISQAVYEVGDDVRCQFVAADPKAADAFYMNPRGRWQADMVKISTQRLHHCGITGINGGQFCTYREAERFFSYRRDGQTGRMVTLIWRSDT